MMETLVVKELLASKPLNDVAVRGNSQIGFFTKDVKLTSWWSVGSCYDVSQITVFNPFVSNAPFC